VKPAPAPRAWRRSAPVEAGRKEGVGPGDGGPRRSEASADHGTG
jgi:hypothetical protein